MVPMFETSHRRKDTAQAIPRFWRMHPTYLVLFWASATEQVATPAPQAFSNIIAPLKSLM